MPESLPRRRVLITVGVLVAGVILLQGLSHGEPVLANRPLRELPLSLNGWQGEERPFQDRIVQALAVDDYVNRLYKDEAGRPVALYVGFYGSQRTGDTIHSPKNCLPGAGWQPVRAARLRVALDGGAPVEINEYLIEKGLERQLVLYWYQARGRVVASEYAGKVWLVVDAITRNRTDGALVRLVAPVAEGEEEVRARLLRFARDLYPQLGEFIPN